MRTHQSVLNLFRIIHLMSPLSKSTKIRLVDRNLYFNLVAQKRMEDERDGPKITGAGGQIVAITVLLLAMMIIGINIVSSSRTGVFAGQSIGYILILLIVFIPLFAIYFIYGFIES